MRHAAPVRQALGVRTVFNLLGPLANPAGATHQVIGVYDRQTMRPMAEALLLLGIANAHVLHGDPGFDEASVCGPTHYIHVADGRIQPTQTITPEQAGLARCQPSEVAPVPKAESSALLRRILRGEEGPRADMVALNAAFALHVTGKAPTLAEGVAQARSILDSGAAGRLLEAYVAATNRP
jgi:anthranilate phosphoribosyltransferase